MQEVVDVKNFLRSTRESGYRSLPLALAELIDNSVEAGSSKIAILIPSENQPPDSWEVLVADDGCGMEFQTLSRCLAFGASSRYDSRSGLGRFGMGLPNSSLSQARRVEVYSWCSKGEIRGVYLDLDEALTSEKPALRACENTVENPIESSSGTIVRWRRLDRETPKSWRQEQDKLVRQIGRIFRQVLQAGLLITVNGEPVCPIDPLLVSAPCGDQLAAPFGEPLIIDASEITGSRTSRSLIEVRFSLLDVHRLAGLSTSDKRMMGVVGGAGVSIVRSGREIDYRWTFIGKRKENYDEWWRCQVSFEPLLDEAFGVTNTKQGVRPTERLKRLLTPSITAVAKVLNGKARAAHAEAAALRNQPSEMAAQHVARLLGSASAPRSIQGSVITPSTLRVFSRRMATPQCYISEGADARVVLNENHPFFRVFYGPLTAGNLSPEEAIRGLDLLLLAMGHHRANPATDLDSLLRLFFGK